MLAHKKNDKVWGNDIIIAQTQIEEAVFPDSTCFHMRWVPSSTIAPHKKPGWFGRKPSRWTLPVWGVYHGVKDGLQGFLKVSQVIL